MNTDKQEQKIRIDLFSANQEKVISALQTVKEKGNKKYLPLLFDLLLNNPETEVEKEIRIILESVKFEDTIPTFGNALLNEKYAPIKKSLLTACWQNGLDFSNFLPVFIDIIVNDDWETAFEAFTVIDNMESLPDQETIKISVTKVKNALKTSTGNKKYFLEEILKKIE